MPTFPLRIRFTDADCAYERFHHFPPESDFIEGMSRVAAAVSIVTTDGAAGRDGMAVTAMSPVSADTERPTLLICVKSTSRPAPVIRANGVFCVNVLAEEQAAKLWAKLAAAQ